MQNTITINGLALVGLLKLAAKKDVRHYLRGIKVEAIPERTRLIATDGHVLGIYETEAPATCQNVVQGGYCEAILPREALGKLRVSPKEYMLVLTINEGMGHQRDAALYNYGTEIKFQTIDAAFPNYTRIIPETVTGEAGAFNPELLAMFLPIAKAMGRAAYNIQLHQNGPRTAAVVTVNACPEFVGVVMPMLAGKSNLRGHVWARKPLNAPQAAPVDPEQAAT